MACSFVDRLVPPSRCMPLPLHEPTDGSVCLCDGLWMLTIVPIS
jgi:hypothetical protein